jgi:putative NADH-flavin reductase
MAAVLVIGASRGIGLETVKAALAAGHRVRALARSAVSVEHERLETLAGDATDPAMLARGVAGVDAVILSLGVSSPFSLAPVTLFSRSTRHLVAAMQAAGVRRLIAVTGLGAGDSRGKGSLLYTKLVFPLILSRIYEDKDVQEDFIRKSGLDWTIVRPGLLTSGPARGRYRVLTEPATWTSGSVSRADVADFLVKQLDDRSLIGATPLLID